MKIKRLLCVILCFIMCFSLWGCDGSTILQDAYHSAPELDLDAYNAAVESDPWSAMIQYEFRVYQYTGEVFGSSKDGGFILATSYFDEFLDMYIEDYDLFVYLNDADTEQIIAAGAAGTYTFAGILVGGETVPMLKNAVILEKISK